MFGLKRQYFKPYLHMSTTHTFRYKTGKCVHLVEQNAD